MDNNSTETNSIQSGPVSLGQAKGQQSESLVAAGESWAAKQSIAGKAKSFLFTSLSGCCDDEYGSQGKRFLGMESSVAKRLGYILMLGTGLTLTIFSAIQIIASWKSYPNHRLGAPITSSFLNQETDPLQAADDSTIKSDLEPDQGAGEYSENVGDTALVVSGSSSVKTATVDAQGIQRFQSAARFTFAELFTSEGCSSCPPADDLLARTLNSWSKEFPGTDSGLDSKVAGNVGNDQAQLILIAYHVDYWNYLGWTDRFSSRDQSARQYWYTKQLAGRTNYTPQLIVDGVEGFVASRPSDLERSLAASAKRQSKTIETANLYGFEVAIDIESIDNSVTGTVDFNPLLIRHCQLTPSATRLWLAIVEDGLTNEVAEGENQGRTLHHDRVLRVRKSVLVDGRSAEKLVSIKLKLPLPNDVNLANCRMVAFVQDEQEMTILAAGESGRLLVE